MGYIMNASLIHSNGNVTNGLNLTDCKPTKDYRYTYNSGVLAAGLAWASKILHQPSYMT